MNNMNMKKQSIIAGGLISSAGIFISKLIGILYVIPLQDILGSQNMVYYGMAFNIYSYILNIATAGIPFAVATIIAKYVTHGDYKTSLLVKKLAIYIMVVFGLISMFFLMLTSNLFAGIMTPQNLGAQGVENMRNVLIAISLALFLVPVLSALRGFYQGLKQMELYAKSQVLEQISRVVFLLVVGALIVYVLEWDRIWATYFAVISTAVAAGFAFIHLVNYDRKQMPELKRLAAAQDVADNDNRKLLTYEIIFIALPFFMVAVLGYSDMIINVLFVNGALQAHGDGAMAQHISSVVFTPVQKIMSIPMVLAPGFSIAIIPHITTSIVKNDLRGIRKNISECLDSVLYIAIPITFCLFVFAKPIMAFITDGGKYLDFDAQVMRWFALEAFISTIAPIFNALMMACRMQKLNIRNLGIYAIIKLATTYPLIAMFGYPGMVISSFISLGVCVLLDIYAINKTYQVKWRSTIRRVMLMIISLIGIIIVSYLCDLVGLKGYGQGMVMNTIQLGISGGLSVLAYFFISHFFQLPQTIFHLDFMKIIRGRKS